MSNRKVRVGELVKREISDILHTRFKTSAVLITITEVDVSPDNKNALVFYSVIEANGFTRKKAQQFFAKNSSMFRRELGKRIVLKFLPALTFAFDEKNRAAAMVNELIDELVEPESETSKSEDSSKPDA
ncbi:30S ribosome-binding factor RbfA [Pelagicoccus sp. NFK12]|uniref:Ribosome-binding factor A n=1 Tax=Pelagicoccus enzymogenes TaxID=2773457 RepID=A0A927F7M0_9BACT|nr:30S ribosome-binding factor RbfA [Pelagicoccus enzymogenes]MBD5779948.1 30S ribosome-binding factor RbfA [Pelagicoccus enzymogenes]MDQ8200808.1 30S ribosome-binding factor RbfA [Pelagicoccus enzymogenes]